MALFGKKKEKEIVSQKAPVSEEKEEKKAPTSPPLRGVSSVAHILRQPRITEKATMVTEEGVYVFEIDPRATKADVKRAVRAIYKVTPRKVHITKTPSKKISSRKRRGVFGRKPEGKKAYVYLEKGKTIDIV